VNFENLYFLPADIIEALVQIVKMPYTCLDCVETQNVTTSGSYRCHTELQLLLGIYGFCQF